MLSPAEARAAYTAVLRLAPRGRELVPLSAALGRVLAADVVSGTDLPPFDRSAVDGWAVRARDTTGATPETPVRMRDLGQVRMGAAADVAVVPGGAVRIPTGGMLPQGADAIVMQEYVDADGASILVRRTARAGDNVVEHGADVQAGHVILTRGRRLRAADLGILAGVGLAEVEVVLPPRVAILATGDEVVPAGAPLEPGRVRDMNSPALAGAVLTAGGSPTLLGIVSDERSAVDDALRGALRDHEMVLVSGGSSVGERDVVADAIGALGPPGIIVHGISVRPGKPTVLAVAGDVPVIGLPGNPVSALVIFDLFARPLLEGLLGIDPASRPWTLVRARLTSALPGAGAREDHRRVTLETRPDGLWAAPQPAGSQILTSLARADGIVVVPPSAGYREGEEVEVRLL
ncbi:MAG TPA: gephyrin-like molybdotransferase Glp [bacterium]|nr:gephyrin-like molybdotransferase Glp [bacterium]